MSSLYRTNYHLRAHKRDAFIEFIKSLLLTPFVLHSAPKTDQLKSPGTKTLNHQFLNEVVAKGEADLDDPVDKNVERYSEILGCIEDLIEDHMIHDNSGMRDISRLTQLVPGVGKFFTGLPLKESFLDCNLKRSIASRTLVPPSFNDVRHILNFAQVKAIAPTLKLITFDGDMTLYADGKDFARDSVLVALMIQLLAFDLYVAIVTAAGYGNDNVKYEKRLNGLLEGIQSSSALTMEQKKRFYVMGVTSNLVYIPEELYQPASMKLWSQDKKRIDTLLNVAHGCLIENCERMSITEKTQIIRKDKAVGVICKPGFELSREQLDELALATQKRLNNFQHVQRVRLVYDVVLPKKRKAEENEISQLSAQNRCEPIPFCAFNGGSDVWVDVGNKLIGVGYQKQQNKLDVSVLMEKFQAVGNQTLHVGDQFLSTGNDISTRSACCTSWIVGPEETAELLTELTQKIEDYRNI
ncbi:IMP 5'-nucleotidase [Lobulomyces angularis]|nr:IMP 5'-nucleotidase [Lobulomyces angularis]